MKKFLTVLILMAAVPVYAGAYEVQFNNAGAPKINTTPVFGQNAAFTPENRARAGAIKRQIKYENAYYENLGKPRNININLNTSNDTFDPDAKPSKVKKRSFLKGKYLKDKLNNEDL